MDRYIGWLAGCGMLWCLAAGCSQTGGGEYHEVAEVPSQPAVARSATAARDSTSAQPLPDVPAVELPPDGSPGDAAAANALQPGRLPAARPSDSAAPHVIQLLIPDRSFQKEGAEAALRVSFDDLDLLKVLNMEPVPRDAIRFFPGWLNQLNGQTIRLRGWMYPPPEQTGLPAFLFVRDNQICCFGRSPKVYDKVAVELRDGVTTDYIQGRPFDVIGRLKIEAEEQDGELFFLYFIEDALVVDG